jgi:hypothetical protein
LLPNDTLLVWEQLPKDWRYKSPIISEDIPFEWTKIRFAKEEWQTQRNKRIAEAEKGTVFSSPWTVSTKST